MQQIRDIVFIAIQSFMGQWNIRINGSNDSDDCIFGQIALKFRNIQWIALIYVPSNFYSNA